MSAYITAAGGYLPGPPVPNDSIEAAIGGVNDEASRVGGITLRSNGIKTRHYARRDGRQVHLNEELAALAISDALRRRGLDPSDIGMLAVGTTIPDLLVPGFASMVHGRLGGAPMEVLSAAGVCGSSIAALKGAARAVAGGDHERAVAAGSELPSAITKSERFEEEVVRAREREDVAPGYRYFNAEFLRWMLSDGAGAVVIERAPRTDGLSLRIDWVSLTSYAHERPTCMFLGTSDPRDISVGKTWLSARTITEAEDAGMLVLRQDTELLDEALVEVATTEIRRLIDTGCIDPDGGYDWLLPHISSFYFYERAVEGVRAAGLDIPEDRWFIKLENRGAMGAATVYLTLVDALDQEVFRPGDRILVFVPESARFLMGFMQLTAVGPDGADAA